MKDRHYSKCHISSKWQATIALWVVFASTAAVAFQLPTAKTTMTTASTATNHRMVTPTIHPTFSTLLATSNTDTEEEPASLFNNNKEKTQATEHPSLSSKSLVESADEVLKIRESVETADSGSALNRRMFMGAALIGTSAILGQTGAGGSMAANAANNWNDLGEDPTAAQYAQYGKLAWQLTPVNKRTGVTVFDAEKAGYKVRFVTYLSRFLLSFDYDCGKWWYSRAADIPLRATSEEVEEIRLKQFGAFSASVEVGLQEYRGNEGPALLMSSLLIRYCPDIETVKLKRAKRGLPPLTEQEENKERREIKEARRQIALLFGLMEVNQPVDKLTQLLAAIDNGSIVSVKVENGGSGYAPGYGTPLVTFPPPMVLGLPDFKTATGRATLKPNGRILRIDMEHRGSEYPKAPTVIISSPGADRGVDIPGTRAATAKAFVFKNGANKGRLDRIQLIDPGEGYIEGEEIRVVIGEQGGVKDMATAKAIRELEVASIEIVNGGTGYAMEKPIPVYIEPPPLTARVNMNDPLNARIIDPNQPLPTSTTFANTPQQQRRSDPSDPNSRAALVSKLAKNDGKGGGGGCIGRACYDQPVVAFARAKAESSSFNSFRNPDDARLSVEKEEKILKEKRVVSAATSGANSQLPTVFWNGGPSSSSSQLLTLLPAGLGLEYDRDLKRFVLAASPDFSAINPGSSTVSNLPLDPEFGPRGRSPIERDLTLDASSFARFCASGAVCAGGAHLLLTPLDVVKTKIQTDPENYPGIISTIQKLIREAGPTGFFAGWVPTTIGFFFWGGFSYSVTELLRRYFTDSFGAGFEIPIILAASAIAAFFSVFILCPFEAVRIRSVAQPDYGKNALEVTTRMIKEEGADSFFNAVPPFMLKEIPFGVSKFVVFTLATRYLYQAFPATQEDIQLSLLVTLASGMLGGLVAAIVSNPADATISEMKKAKSKISPTDAVQGLIEKGGWQNLFRGLPVRMGFYPLMVSLQFFVYDTVRLYLGVGSDDLKVYLDVLGGALKDGGSMVGPV